MKKKRKKKKKISLQFKFTLAVLFLVKILTLNPLSERKASLIKFPTPPVQPAIAIVLN